MEEKSKKLILVYFYLGKATEAGLVNGGTHLLSPKGFDLAMELIESGEKLTRDDVLRAMTENGIGSLPEQYEALAFIIMKIQDDGYSTVVAEDEEFENTKALAAQCVAGIRKHRVEMDSTLTTLIRARRACKHRYVYTGFDSTYSYAQCQACLNIVRWEHGLPDEHFVTDGQRPNLPEAGTPVTPPDGMFYPVPGPENYMV